MIVRDFVEWLESASASARADAADALARSFLRGDAPADMREGMEAALTLLLDDPSPLVRFALAEALADSFDAPRHLILGLAADRTDIAALVLARSPVLLDGELVDLVATMSGPVQEAIASRPRVSPGVAAAVAELGGPIACTILLGNEGAQATHVSLARLAERFGGHAELRSLLLDRPDLPGELRQLLIHDLNAALEALVIQRGWLDTERARRLRGDACDEATVTLAADTDPDDLATLAEHLRDTGQLTAALALRALCTGNLGFFAAALSVLSGVPERRVVSLVNDRRSTALRAVYARAGLPPVAFDAFAAAVATCRSHGGESDDPAMRRRLTRRTVEAVLARYESVDDSGMNELTAMLRRFAADAARAAAREYVGAEMIGTRSLAA